MNEQSTKPQPGTSSEEFTDRDPGGDNNWMSDGNTTYPKVVPDMGGYVIHFGKGYNWISLSSDQTKQLLFELITKTNPPAILQRPNLMRFVCALGIAVGVAIGVGFMSLVIIVLVKFF